jgi:tripartite ATP-independent transporter DctP family solute receptor
MSDIRWREFMAVLDGAAAPPISWVPAARVRLPSGRMRRSGELMGMTVKLNQGGGISVKFAAILVIVAVGLFPASVPAQYKPEFKMSVVPNSETSWGRAAIRFADGIKFRTNGRIQIKTYFEGRLFAGEQTSEFQLLQQGIADFAIGSTINWSLQVKELNLFALPFMFPNHPALDAVEAGGPGKRLFEIIERKGVVPIAWGENGFREMTNSKRPIRRPEDFHGLNIRVVGVPIFADIFRALGANPVSINWAKAQEAFRQGIVDGQENPIALIIPYQLWAVHKYISLWRYAIDPTILAVSAKTWMSLSPEDQKAVREVGELMMAVQKKEAREGLENAAIVIDVLQKIYEMEVTHLSPADVETFRDKTHSIYNKWADDIGIELVRSTEGIVERAK